MSWDLDRAEAVELAEEHLRAMPPPSNDVWVITSVDERDWDWVVSWVNARAAGGSTAVADLHAGGGPFLIDRKSGRVAMCGSAHPVDHYIEAWQRGDLGDLPRNPAQRYYNPNLTAEQERALLRRNYLLLMTGQAALGQIGPDVLGIAVEPKPGAVVIHIAARRQYAELAQDLDDIASELEVFLADDPEQNSTISTKLHIGPANSGWPGRQHALLYLAKTPSG